MSANSYQEDDETPEQWWEFLLGFSLKGDAVRDTTLQQLAAPSGNSCNPQALEYDVETVASHMPQALLREVIVKRCRSPGLPGHLADMPLFLVWSFYSMACLGIAMVQQKCLASCS